MNVKELKDNWVKNEDSGLFKRYVKSENWAAIKKSLTSNEVRLLASLAYFAVEEHKQEMMGELNLILKKGKSGISYIGYLNDFIKKRRKILSKR